ncbi:MAG: septum site-determining protein MinD [Clostridia bacterium]|nr:septum site-determining protein MinD [Clostridia bacterium]
MGRRILITSGKGGVGKTTACALLGLQLAALGKRVVLVDADITLNNLDMLLGLEAAAVYDLYDVAEGNCRLRQALVRYPYIETLSLLPSVHPLGEVDKRAFGEIMLTLAETNDFVLIDCPAGVDGGFVRAAGGAREALVVTTPSPTALRDADKVLGLLEGYRMEQVGVVVNRVRGDLVLSGEMLSVGDVARLLHARIAGCLPEDDCALAFSPKSSADTELAVAVRYLCRYVLGASKTVYDATRRFRGLAGGLRRLVRRM